MNFYAFARPADFNRVHALALKPGGKVFFQDQHRLPWLVCHKIAIFDGSMDRVIATFCQFGSLIYRQGIIQDHFLHASSTASLISKGLPQTQVTLLMPVASSNRKATAGGQRRLPRII
jgi:hypothetical protein